MKPAEMFTELTPYDGASREAWFFRVARITGIKKSRVRSLFYNPQCRMTGDELLCIQDALAAKTQTLKVRTASALAEVESLELKHKEISHEQMEALYRLAVQVVHLFGGSVAHRR